VLKGRDIFKTVRATNHRVDDGRVHVIEFVGTDSAINLKLDHTTTDIVEVDRFLLIDGNVFLGGVPDIEITTNSEYRENFNGCVHIFETPYSGKVYLGENAVSARNVVPCSERPLSNDLFGRFN